MDAPLINAPAYRFGPGGSPHARIALGLGIATLIGAIAAMFSMRSAETLKHFQFAYLVAYCFCLSIALGGLFFVLLQHLTGARWSVVLRRLAESVMLNLDLMALLFVPILFWIPSLYKWANPEYVAGDPLLQWKQPYLNVPFFIGRMIFYFVVWNLLARFFYRNSVRQDASGDPALTLKMRKWSAPSMLLFALTITFFAFDVIMTLDPHWFSTIFGVYFFGGSFLAFLAALVILSNLVLLSGAVGKAITAEHFHDVGKLLFAFVVFWTYIAFSQLLLIWMANIPEETLWYIHRWQSPGWRAASWVLLFGHFVIPFFFLLPRTIKRNRTTLMFGALWLLAMHYLDLYWLIMPVFEHGAFPLTPMEPLLCVAMAGLFLWIVLARLGRQHVVPIRDPYLADSLAFENF